MIKVDSAARRICSNNGWQISQLALQKLLYLSHMIALGRGVGPLIEGGFQAWDYGPVHPRLYQQVKMFGDRPVRDIFFNASDIGNSLEGQIIDEVCAAFKDKTPGDLVAITHWDDGAWAKHYQPRVRGIPIPDGDITDEYRRRNAA